MAAGDVHRELTVHREPFCGLLGMTVRQKNPFVLETVLSLSIHLNLFIRPTVDIDKALQICNTV